jgi:Flp pilus assembly protein TadB
MVVLSVLGAAGLVLMISGWMQPAPTLARTIEHLRRPGTMSTTEASTSSSGANRLLEPVVRIVSDQPRLRPSSTELQLADRTVDQHVLYMVVAALLGLIVPPVLLGALQSAGLISLQVYVPVVAALGAAVLGPVIVHTTLVDQANETRIDLRYQVSAYLDVVTMLLAGNTGYEGALEQAAYAGDGRLFVELRRRMRESSARGSSLTEALQRTGAELGLDELEQVAATAALSAAEGAPVARTLAAKCATLRAALATEQESEARLRTSRLTTPIVGMALIFMALVMYPALNFS